jgi:chaperone modulatory protein CbpM
MNMENEIIKVYEGILIEEEHELTLMQLCDACGTSPEEIIEMIHEGILENRGRGKTSWRFSYYTVHRYRKANRLKNDLGINLSGVAMVLELLDRIDELESRLKNYAG